MCMCVCLCVCGFNGCWPNNDSVKCNQKGDVVLAQKFIVLILIMMKRLVESSSDLFDRFPASLNVGHMHSLAFPHIAMMKFGHHEQSISRSNK